MENEEKKLEDYELQVEEKKSFINKIISKLKSNKDKKLLPAGTSKPKKTYQSILSMWKIATARASLLNALEKVNKIVIKQKTTLKNKYKAYIIGKQITEETTPEEDEKILQEKENIADIAPIIPKAISKTIQYNNLESNKDKEKP